MENINIERVDVQHVRGASCWCTDDSCNSVTRESVVVILINTSMLNNNKKIIKCSYIAQLESAQCALQTKSFL